MFPPPPPAIADALAFAQYVSIDRQVPLLHLISILNVLLVMGLSMHDRLPVWTYAWMPALMLYSLVRISNWREKSLANPDAATRHAMLFSATRVTLILLAVFSTWGMVTLVLGVYSNPLIIPMAMMFGGICVAHSLVAIRSAAIGGTIISVLPLSIGFLLTPDFAMKMLGTVLGITGLLKIHVNASLYKSLLRALHLEQQNKLLANTDSLTGLSNRRAMMALLDRAIASAKQDGGHMGVAIMDLDGFKAINDSHGHHAGDALLVDVADRLRAGLHPDDLAGRLGGDEFILICRKLNAASDMDARVSAVMASLARGFQIDASPLAVGASLGYATLSTAHPDARELLIAADKALYSIKREERSVPHFHKRAAQAA